MKLVEVEPVWTPQTRQRIFRALLEATAYPGRLFDIGDILVGASAALGILSCLVDEAVTWSDDDNLIGARDRQLLNAPLAKSADADYILSNAANPPADNFVPQLGTIYRPDSASTLILNCVAVGTGNTELHLTGPGIETMNALNLDGVHGSWFDRRKTWTANFPTGVDMIFCDNRRIVAIPRTTRIERQER